MNVPGGVIAPCANPTRSCSERPVMTTRSARKTSFFVMFFLLQSRPAGSIREFRRSGLHQGCDPVGIDADDDITCELLGIFPLVRGAGRNDEDVALRYRDVL